LISNSVTTNSKDKMPLIHSSGSAAAATAKS